MSMDFGQTSFRPAVKKFKNAQALWMQVHCQEFVCYLQSLRQTRRSGLGCHVVCALMEGCRLSVFGTHPSISYEQTLIDHTRAANPGSLLKLLTPDVGLAETAFFEPCTGTL